MLRHVVFFNWNDRATDQDKQDVATGLRALPGHIPEIRRYELGPDAGLAEGNFDFVLVADFETLEDYQIYQAHPEHLRVIQESIKPAISARAAVQYWLS